MTAVRGVVVVFLGGVGLWVLVGALPRFRRTVLARRLTPYLGALGPRRSDLLGATPPASGMLAVFDPVRAAIADRLHRLLDDGPDLPDRLQASGSGLDPSAFRAQQVTWGLVGALAGLSVGALGLGVGRSVSPMVVLGLVTTFGIAGIAARDRALTGAVARRQESIRTALPTFVDLICLGVTAGESLRGALGMVTQSAAGPLADELRSALRSARAGTPLTQALEARARIVDLAPFARFVSVVVAAQERGMPLADALRSLAFDLREQEKRDLIEVAGRKQIAMLVPVIALILPVAIVFAFYPGVVAIRTLAR